MPLSNWLCIHPSSATTDISDTVSLDNRGLAYGDGFFTTMGVIDGQILWLAHHQQRLVSHAEALQLELDNHSIMAIIRTHAEQLQQGMLKLMVTRAVQDVRGYGYVPTASGSACEIWLKSSAMTVTTTEQLRLPDGCLIPMQPISSAICLSSQLTCLPPLLAGLKSLNRLDNVLASGELQSIKAQVSEDNIKPRISEGLLRDMSGRWVEGTMSNVFYQLSDSPLSTLSSEKTASEKLSTLPLYEDNANYLTTGQWYTPSMAQSGVAGVMRQVLIDALSTSKHPVIIRSLKDEDLPRLSQLFFCNALRGVMPMSSLTLLSGEVVGF
ncbi:aminodeoxychorismate lyase apoprotein [Psychrobacter immobilis]|uniref:Aminodeoxychorismate lyase apoprotein n=3 Tax=Psychrobacter TaxID=497 RepID=A0A2V1ZXW6_PSYIM|nr:aminotransferase class IV [Psychrobacter immobilis]PWK13697.1 aminodeoxychorismate lyase apoprotein [Psychrobacter immobilis]